MSSNHNISECNEITMFQVLNWKNLKKKIFYFSKTENQFQSETLPSATPHGYLRPRTRFPSTSITEFAPTIANGTRLLSCRITLASSSSSNGSGKS